MYWHHDDWPLFGFVSVPPVGNGISSPSAAFDLWSESFAGIYERGGHFNFCMHPFLTGRPAYLRLLERLIRFMRGFPRVWWAPLSEIASHLEDERVTAALERQEASVPPPDWITA